MNWSLHKQQICACVALALLSRVVSLCKNQFPAASFAITFSLSRILKEIANSRIATLRETKLAPDKLESTAKSNLNREFKLCCFVRLGKNVAMMYSSNGQLKYGICVCRKRLFHKISEKCDSFGGLRIHFWTTMRKLVVQCSLGLLYYWPVILYKKKHIQQSWMYLRSTN